MDDGLRAIGRAVAMGAAAFALLLAFNLAAQSVVTVMPPAGAVAVAAIPLAQP